jgi:hypothetical protein
VFPHKNILPHILEELHIVLGCDEGRWNATMDRPPLLAPGTDPFGGVYQLPPEFVHALAKVPQGELARISEEWVGDNRTARTFLVGLRKLSISAVRKGKGMYLLIVV